MRKIVFGLSALLCFSSMTEAFLPSPTQTQSKIVQSIVANPSDDCLNALMKNSQLLKGIEQIQFNDDGKSIISMVGNLSEEIQGDLKTGTQKFLNQNSELFNIPANPSNSRIELSSMVEECGVTHFCYSMKCCDIPVYMAYVELHVGKNRSVQLANGTFPTIEGFENEVKLNEKDALLLAQEILNVDGLRGRCEANLVVIPNVRNKGTLAYHVNIPASEPLGDWEIIIDAENGNEISRINQMNFSSDFNGKASVYEAHPVKAAPIVTDIPHLTTSSLSGLYSLVINAKTASANSDTNTYIFSPDDTHFDEANVYYNVNRVHDFFKQLGFDEMDYSMKAEVHYKTKYDNAFYSPTTDSMGFGDGNKLNDFSKEESVCFHEYSHAVLRHIKKFQYSGESGAINEGQADYFACSLSNDPLTGEWILAKINKPWERNLTDKVHYPEDIKNEVHADGRIWGCTLWDIRTALGAKIADLLIHKSFFYIPAGSPRFIDGMNAILTADQNLNNGANKIRIQEIFSARGIGKAPGNLTFTGTELKNIISFRNLHQKYINAH
ncbi:MAG: M36 family metallopeptidase [Candidatus Riflebacteria bacterium]|nr:M36 family metallopeptidase [Candidatus Riflebacteria bacterium]